MDFVNETDFGAGFLNTVSGEDHLLGAVIARPTFRVEDERLVPTPDRPWPIDPAPKETPYGTFPGDTPFLSGGIDLFVVGNAYQPAGRPEPELRVDIRVGEAFNQAVRVVGDRTWKAIPKTSMFGDTSVELRATAPEPFVSMPLGYDRAFGGAAKAENLDYSYPSNPGGKGLYLSAEQAENQPLPNLEDYDDPIATFEDRPEPVGTAPYPTDGSLRPLNALDLETDEEHPENTRIRRIKPLFFNGAHPRMILRPDQTPGAGETVEVTHVRPDGGLKFSMPDVALHAHVQLEDRNHLFPLHLDQIGILAEEESVFLSYRVTFRYRFTAMERRRTTLHAGELPAELPAHYPRSWDE